MSPILRARQLNPSMPAVEPIRWLRPYLTLVAKLTISVGLLWLLFQRTDFGRLWTLARNASLLWIVAAVASYTFSVLVSIWRWNELLRLQRVPVTPGAVSRSFLVALFFNNFLPSNVGGDVIRIRDTAGPAGSNAVAATIVLADRVIGLLGLVLIAAFGATMSASTNEARLLPFSPGLVWVGFVAATAICALLLVAPRAFGGALAPLERLIPGGVIKQIEAVVGTLRKFRGNHGVLARCFLAAVLVQVSNVAFYVAVAYALHVNVTPWSLSVIVPLTALVQALPVSINGFGVREATFSMMFAREGLPVESALVVSLVAMSLIMLFSLAGAGVYLARHRQPAEGQGQGLPLLDDAESL